MPTALITGASSGLGEEFARQLARRKFDLVLTARRKERLETVADESRRLGAGNTMVIEADLSNQGTPAEIHQRVSDAGVTVDYLVNNAGFGTRGRFDRLPLARELEEVNLNVTALVALCRLFIPAMAERRRSIVINVASTAGFQPVPFMATYAATKAFVLSFSEALAEEFAEHGVNVMALCPGPTHTEFQAVAKVEDSKMPRFAYMDAPTVVRQAIDAAERGKAVCITGAMNFMLAQSTRIAPRRLVAKIAGSMFRVA